jgi:hypothetical protein
MARGARCTSMKEERPGSEDPRGESLRCRSATRVVRALFPLGAVEESRMKFGPELAGLPSGRREQVGIPRLSWPHQPLGHRSRVRCL